MIGVALVVISVVIALIWISFEMKRLKHKIWAIVLIGLVLFGYFSFAVTLKGEEINYGSVEGILQAGKIYFSWVGSIFGNVKSITGSAVKMDWTSTNSSSSR